MVPVEVVSLGAMVLHASTGVTAHASTAVTVHAATAVTAHAPTAVTTPASTAVTAFACRLAGRVDGQHDSQCHERHDSDLFRNHNFLHVMPRFSFPLFRMVTLAGRFAQARRWRPSQPRFCTDPHSRFGQDRDQLPHHRGHS